MFKEYMIYMALVFLVVAIITLMIFMKRKKKVITPQKLDPINCGNISVMFDSSLNVTIIPYIKDIFGSGKATNNVTYLNIQYNAPQLGNTIRGAMLSCAKGVMISDKELMNSLGLNSWKEFSKDKKCISICYREGVGLGFNSTIRKSDGSYSFRCKGFDATLDSKASNLEIGEMVLSLSKKCMIVN